MANIYSLTAPKKRALYPLEPIDIRRKEAFLWHEPEEEERADVQARPDLHQHHLHTQLGLLDYDMFDVREYHAVKATQSYFPYGEGPDERDLAQEEAPQLDFEGDICMKEQPRPHFSPKHVNWRNKAQKKPTSQLKSCLRQQMKEYEAHDMPPDWQPGQNTVFDISDFIEGEDAREESALRQRSHLTPTHPTTAKNAISGGTAGAWSPRPARKRAFSDEDTISVPQQHISPPRHIATPKQLPRQVGPSLRQQFLNPPPAYNQTSPRSMSLMDPRNRRTYRPPFPSNGIFSQQDSPKKRVKVAHAAPIGSVAWANSMSPKSAAAAQNATAAPQQNASPPKSDTAPVDPITAQQGSSQMSRKRVLPDNDAVSAPQQHVSPPRSIITPTRNTNRLRLLFASEDERSPELARSPLPAQFPGPPTGSVAHYSGLAPEEKQAVRRIHVRYVWTLADYVIGACVGFFARLYNKIFGFHKEHTEVISISTDRFDRKRRAVGRVVGAGHSAHLSQSIEWMKTMPGQYTEASPAAQDYTRAQQGGQGYAMPGQAAEVSAPARETHSSQTSSDCGTESDILSAHIMTEGGSAAVPVSQHPDKAATHGPQTHSQQAGNTTTQDFQPQSQQVAEPIDGANDHAILAAKDEVKNKSTNAYPNSYIDAEAYTATTPIHTMSPLEKRLNARSTREKDNADADAAVANLCARVEKHKLERKLPAWRLQKYNQLRQLELDEEHSTKERQEEAEKVRAELARESQEFERIVKERDFEPLLSRSKRAALIRQANEENKRFEGRQRMVGEDTRQDKAKEERLSQKMAEVTLQRNEAKAAQAKAEEEAEKERREGEERQKLEKEAKQQRKIAEQEAEVQRQQKAEQEAVLQATRDILVRPLDPKWDQILATNMATGNGMKVLATSPDGVEITRYTLGKILPQKDANGMVVENSLAGTEGKKHIAGWLDDEAVNAFFSTIVQSKNDLAGYVKGPNNVPSFVAYNTGWYKTYKDRGIHNLKNWSRRKGMQGEKLLRAERIFFPINTGAHWTLLIISPQARSIEFLDSANGRKAPYIEIARQWLRMELGDEYDETEWEGLESESQRQMNFDDCGIFTCINALASAKGKPFSAVPATKGMEDARRMIVAVLLNGGFHGDWQL